MRPLKDPSFGLGPGFSAGARPVYYRRRDPAPSRLAFRLERLWLTPEVRVFARFGAPVIVVALALAIWFGNEGRREAFAGWVDGIRVSIENRPEFMLKTFEVTGAGPEVAEAARMMLPVQLPASRFAIDLDAYRDAIARLDAVKDVTIVARSGGVLQAKIVEREPVILWRTPSGVELLDDTGHRVASLTRRDARPDLALIAGDGADRAVPEALDILAAAKPILARARGLVRVGERRWDIDLVGGRRIMLPERNPVAALKRVLALDASEDLLSRDFTRIDMRDGERPTVRLSADALEQYEVAVGLKKPSHRTAASASTAPAAAAKAAAQPTTTAASATPAKAPATAAKAPAEAASTKAAPAKAAPTKAPAAKTASAASARPTARPTAKPPIDPKARGAQ